MLLRGSQQLCYPGSQVLGKDVKSTSKLVSTRKVYDNFDKVIEKLDLVECDVVH